MLEGGGVKGVALVGAFSVLEERGYEPEMVAGASAGAIVESLIATGELSEFVGGLDYSCFKDESWTDRLPLVGTPMSVLKDLGIYEGAYFEDWVRDLLEKRDVRTFGDLVWREDAPEPRLHHGLRVIASDLTERRLLILPRYAASLGVGPDDLDVALAVRMSMSIPLFFGPVRFLNPRTERECLIVDGGMLSNYPVWLFDADEPLRPTFGLKPAEPDPRAPAGRGPRVRRPAFSGTSEAWWTR